MAVVGLARFNPDSYWGQLFIDIGFCRKTRDDRASAE